MVRRVVAPRARRTSGAPSPRWSRCSPKAAPPARSTARCRPGALTTTFTASPGPAADDPQHVQDRRRADPASSCTSPPAPSPPTPSRSSATTPTSWPAARPASPCSRSDSVQEAHDFAADRPGRHACESRVPFLHFFDGFRTSHEVAKIELLTDDDLRAMIDDELVRRPPRPRASRPDHPVCAAPPRTPTSSSRPARPATPSTTPAPASSRRRWTSSPSSTGRQYQLFDYVGAPDAERVDRGHGLRRRHRPGDRRMAWRQGREGRRAQGPPVSGPSRSKHFVDALPADRQDASPCSTAPRSRAPSASRSTWTCVTALRRSQRRGHQPLRRPARGRRRPLRPVLQGIHPGHGQGGLRRPGQGHSRRTTSPSASSTT